MNDLTDSVNAQAALTDKLERGAPHPCVDVEVFWSVLDLKLEGYLKL